MLQFEKFDIAKIQAQEHFSDEVLNSISTALETLSDSTQYGGSMFIEDAIWEVSEDAIPIHRATVLRQGVFLEDYACQAIREGILATNPDTFSLHQLLQAAWCLLLRHYCHEAIHTVIYNYMADYLNGRYDDFDGAEEKIEDALWDVAQEHESGDMFEELDAIAESIYKRETRN